MGNMRPSNHLARAIVDWWPENLRWRIPIDVGVLVAGLYLAYRAGWKAGVKEEAAIVGFGIVVLIFAEAVRLLWHIYRAPFRQRDELRATLNGAGDSGRGMGLVISGEGTVWEVVSRGQEGPDVRTVKTSVPNRSMWLNPDKGRVIKAIRFRKPDGKLIVTSQLPSSFNVSIALKDRIVRMIEKTPQPRVFIHEVGTQGMRLEGRGLDPNLDVILDLYYEPMPGVEPHGEMRSTTIFGTTAQAGNSSESAPSHGEPGSS